MSDKKLTAHEIALDEHGRVILDDDLLESLAHHDPSLLLAGGSNAQCANSRCSNMGCDSPLQVNTGCSNTSCTNNNNQSCENKYADDNF